MPEALALVKRELGDQAVILGTRTCPRSGIRGAIGREQVEITAAPPMAITPAPRSTPARPGETRSASVLPVNARPFYDLLAKAGIDDALAAKLARDAAALMPRGSKTGLDDVREAVRQAIQRNLKVAGGIGPDGEGPHRVALVGPAGGGKTTTLAKLAAHFRLRHRRRVALLSLDMQRLACGEQLKRYAQIIGVPAQSAQSVNEVKDALRELPPHDLLLIDTHGIALTERTQLARLTSLLRAVRPNEVHLVLPATTVTSVQKRIAQMHACLGVSRVLLTHLDEAGGLGSVLNTLSALEWGLSYVTSGQQVPTDLAEASGERIANLVFP